jgi:plasmid replication initiation protein
VFLLITIPIGDLHELFFVTYWRVEMNGIIQVSNAISKENDHFNKAVGTIHIRVQSGSLGLIQRKLINAFHFFAKDNPNKETHYVRRQDLLKMINYNSNNIGEFKENARKLTNISVEWDYLREDTERVWGVSNIISEIEYVTNGIVAFSFPRRIREFMATQVHRGLVCMQVQKKFTMSYALSLYENATIYREKGSTPKFSVNELKTLLVVNDEENPTYKLFKYFNNKVIIPAVNEINEVSDIFVEPIYYKNGRVVEFISFTVVIKPQSFLDFNEVPNITSLHDRLVSFGCNSKAALDIIEKYDIEYILGNLDYVESQLIASGEKKIRNPMGFFIDALAKDYRTKEPEIIKKAREKREADAKKKIEEEKLKLEERNKLAEKNRLLKESVKSRYYAMSEDDKTGIQESFLVEMKNTNKLVAKKFIESGLKSSMVSSIFFNFLYEFWNKEINLDS